MAQIFPLELPSVIQIRHKKCMFFLGDRWVLVGPVQYGLTPVPPFGRMMEVPIPPDLDVFFADREYLRDGSDEWREWGPRLN